jgi:hypothetical protein
VQGKGANTPFILESRGLSRAETMSSLLERHNGIRELMDKGELVPDTMVCAQPCPMWAMPVCGRVARDLRNNNLLMFYLTSDEIWELVCCLCKGPQFTCAGVCTLG